MTTTQNTPVKISECKNLKEFLNHPMILEKVKSLVSKNTATFTTSIMQIVNSNTSLKKAEPMSIFNAACMAATLNLPLQNGLGFAYIVPYQNKREKKTEAQFQLGYKGLIQLAQRSGQFKRLVAVPVYEKQLINEDPINGYEFDWKQKPEQGEAPIGYYAYFKLINDFTAEIYMTYDEVNEHAKKYSQTYRTYLQKKANGQWASSVWGDNFDAMALKTVMKLLLSKQAPLSVEMQNAVLADQAVVKDVDNKEFAYVDNEIQDAEIVMTASEEEFERCKQNITNKETTLQDLCDNGFEFSKEQYDELERLENELQAQG
ncbi:recombinase RecT [Basfia succiniciproducens]|uniref:recombinase RecT n=1 Tax=Basfia succiniciproducens TaxID=653940 RepID=UPI0008D4CAE0|nr:recombinase RecT [Basfia succiniciproducens]SEP87396.1 recombination protein RecT [Basfia succiniciproducens]